MQSRGKQEVTSASFSKQQRKLMKTIINQKILAVQEKKSFDVGFATTVADTGATARLTAIPQGDTDSSRQGDHVKLLKGELISAASYSDTTNCLRLIIYRWNQDDSSSAPTVSDILQTTSPYSPLNRDNERARKFDVIVDHQYVVSNVGQGVDKFRCSMNLKSQIAFQATATSGTGHLYYFVVSDSAGVPHPSLSFIWRTYYTDS